MLEPVARLVEPSYPVFAFLQRSGRVIAEAGPKTALLAGIHVFRSAGQGYGQSELAGVESSDGRLDLLSFSLILGDGEDPIERPRLSHACNPKVQLLQFLSRFVRLLSVTLGILDDLFRLLFRNVVLSLK